jgi:hypothetical protein
MSGPRPTDSADDDEGDDIITPDDDVVVTCPYCGEENPIVLDPGGGTAQDYVEDCQVCCRPWQVHVRWDRDGHADVQVDAADS